MSLMPGNHLGSYRVDAAIGEGGMAQVFRVWNESLQRAEALKLLSPKLAADREFVKRFLREAQTAAGLQHNNIATIYTVSPQSEAQPYFTMELLDGVDLADLLQQRGGRLSEQEAIAWLKQVAAGLDYAHSKGVIHRDIKPANVLVTREGVAKLVDFGIARAAETSGDARLTQTGMIVGTPDYMSPEQARGDAEVTPASDQYGLACVAFELLTGRPPFSGRGETSQMQVLMNHLQTPPPDPRTLGVSEGISRALERALSKEPGQRFASCQEFVQALDVIPPPGGTVVTRPASGGTTSPPVAPPRNFLPAIGIAAVCGVALIAYALLRPQPPALLPEPTPSASSQPVPSEDKVTVPDLKGMTESRAREDAEKLGLKPINIGEGSSTLPKGVVCEQIPAVGDSVASGSKIEFRLSRGSNDDPGVGRGAADNTPSPSTDGWRTHVSESLPFIIEVPASWRDENGKEGQERWVNFSGPEGTVIKVQFSRDSRALDPYSNFLGLQSRIGGSVSSGARLAGVSGASWNYTKTSGPNRGKYDEEIGIAYQGRGVTFEMIAPAEVFDKYRSTFERAKNSMVLH